MTDYWTGGQASTNAEKIVELLRLNDLTAVVNTLFQPKSNNTVHTYLQTKRKRTGEAGDEGEHMGRTVKSTYKGRETNGINCRGDETTTRTESVDCAIR